MTALDQPWIVPDGLREIQDPKWLIDHKPDMGQMLMRSTNFGEGAYEFCVTRRRGRTKRGYVGQFSVHACIGDTIFIPYGSAIPFLIRRKISEEDTYELIEECYVHGIMEGEGFSVEAATVKDVHIV